MLISKKLPEINAGSMADIAFLLLVFFLVTTTMQQDKGLRVLLPQWTPDVEPINVYESNILQVVLTGNDQLFVKDKKFEVENLKEQTMRFVLNNGKDPNLSQRPRLARVLLTNDNNGSYDLYLRVSNEIHAAYNEIWEAGAQDVYGKAWDVLSKAEQATIKGKFPKTIIETETNF